MLVSELQTELSLHTHDPNNGEISLVNWLNLINSAARDARNNGWYLPLEDNESLTIAANDFNYAVPATFAAVEKLLMSETSNSTTVYVHEIPAHHWEIRTDGGVPVFEFNTITQLTVDATIKVVGQKRPTIYTLTSETVDPGMESFLRERALYFGFRFLGAGLSELSRWRQDMSKQCWATSEAFLLKHPQEFRMRPDVRVVDGR